MLMVRKRKRRWKMVKVKARLLGKVRMMMMEIMRKTRRNHFTPASLPLGVAEEGF